MTEHNTTPCTVDPEQRKNALAACYALLLQLAAEREAADDKTLAGESSAAGDTPAAEPEVQDTVYQAQPRMQETDAEGVNLLVNPFQPTSEDQGVSR